MSAHWVAMRAATTAAVAGLAWLTLGAGPSAPIPAAQSPVTASADNGTAAGPVRLQPFRLVYRQVEGTYLKAPRGVFFDQARGEVYVADTMNDLVAVYDRDGLPLFAFGYNGEFKEPIKAVVDGRGRIYVLAGIGRKLKVFSYRGEYLHDFPFHGVEGKAVPIALTADVEGNVYIADSTSGQILVYDADQRLKLQFGNERAGDGRFRTVQALAVDRKGQIYVADAREMPVQVFSREGRFLRGWGEHSLGPQNFSLPAGLAVDADGRIIVVDTIRQVVSVFTPEGAFLDRFGGLGFAPGAMSFPTDVASDGERRIYVVERMGSRLQILDERAIAGRRAPPAPRPVPPATRDELQRSLGELLRGKP